MCPWVGSHAPSFGRHLWGLPSRMEYLSPQGVLLPRVYGTIASPLRLELRALSAWQATRSWTVYRFAFHRLLPWLQVTFAMVPDAAWPGSDQRPWGTAPVAGPVGRLGRISALHPWGVACSFPSLGRPTCARVCGVHGPLALVQQCARIVCSVRSVCGVPGLLAAVHRCACPVRCVACAVSLATWLLFAGVFARCVVLRVRCPGPLGSCSALCSIGALCLPCGVLGHLSPVHRCARLVRCVACAVSWASWLLFTRVSTPCAVLRVRPPGRLCSCSRACSLGALSCICRDLGQLAPVHRCVRSVPCVACAVSVATWHLFAGVLPRCVVLCVRCPGPLGCCSSVCPLDALSCVCGVLGHLAPAQRCAHSVPGLACTVSWATSLLFARMLAPCVVLRVPCPWPLGSCSPVCPPEVLCCLCVVLGHLATAHQCVDSVRCLACAVS